ncbi:unnamed protein product [Moneuplotes crassus]|uniref:Uncharacterized protein n=1 Tax=Euplotes crassus TaxID=5936 RepID=A0AAD1UGF6_EUPCR|nr:unnamed protein product [Moneuplotes crassus]
MKQQKSIMWEKSQNNSAYCHQPHILRACLMRFLNLNSRVLILLKILAPQLILTQPNYPKPLKSSRTKRKDIYRRKILRHIKKFFLELFKYHNDKLFNKRLIRHTSDTILEALANFCEIYIEQVDSIAMAKFMFKAMNLNFSNVFTDNSGLFQFGEKFHKYAKSYNDTKFEGLFASEHFRAMINSFITLRGRSKEIFDKMKTKTQWKYQFRTNEEVFTRITSTYIGQELGEAIEARLQEAFVRCIQYVFNNPLLLGTKKNILIPHDKPRIAPNLDKALTLQTADDDTEEEDEGEERF